MKNDKKCYSFTNSKCQWVITSAYKLFLLCFSLSELRILVFPLTRWIFCLHFYETEILCFQVERMNLDAFGHDEEVHNIQISYIQASLYCISEKNNV